MAQILGLTKTFAQYPADRFALEIVLFEDFQTGIRRENREIQRPKPI